jgi:hypothetical protein
MKIRFKSIIFFIGFGYGAVFLHFTTYDILLYFLKPFFGKKIQKMHIIK